MSMLPVSLYCLTSEARLSWLEDVLDMISEQALSSPSYRQALHAVSSLISADGTPCSASVLYEIMSLMHLAEVWDKQ